MEEASARAALVDFAGSASPLLTTIPRREVEEAVQTEDGPPDLILDVARVTGAGDAQTTEMSKVSVSWSRDDLEQLLRTSSGESVTLAFDAEELAGMLGDVEGHGIREVAAVLAVAVAAGTSAGVAAAQPAEQAALGSGYTSIEQVRSEAAVTPPAADIEAVRSAEAATTAAVSAPAADIEAVRSAEAAATAVSAPAADIEAVRSAEAATAASTSPASAIETFRSAEAAAAASTSPASAIETFRSAEAATAETGIESVRSAEAAAVRLTPSVDIEAVRSAAQAASRTAASGGGTSISMPDPATTGAIVGGIALLITGAAFALRRRESIRPA